MAVVTVVSMACCPVVTVGLMVCCPVVMGELMVGSMAFVLHLAGCDRHCDYNDGPYDERFDAQPLHDDRSNLHMACDSKVACKIWGHNIPDIHTNHMGNQNQPQNLYSNHTTDCIELKIRM